MQRKQRLNIDCNFFYLGQQCRLLLPARYKNSSNMVLLRAAFCKISNKYKIRVIMIESLQAIFYNCLSMATIQGRSIYKYTFLCPLIFYVKWHASCYKEPFLHLDYCELFPVEWNWVNISPPTIVTAIDTNRRTTRWAKKLPNSPGIKTIWRTKITKPPRYQNNICGRKLLNRPGFELEVWLIIFSCGMYFFFCNISI